MSDEQVGYTSDGLVWMSYVMDHKGVPMKAMLTMPPMKAKDLGMALIGASDEAVKQLKAVGHVRNSKNTH
jgi:hypothetical protein